LWLVWVVARLAENALIAFACTSGSRVIGESRVAEFVRSVGP